jgi:hypothetical protein
VRSSEARSNIVCHDGSGGSKTALAAAGEVIKPADAVPLARAGSFVVAVPNDGEVVGREAAIARKIAEEVAAVAHSAATSRRDG